MLVLTRRVGESIVIAGDIEVVIAEIRSNNQVRIGITAPREIPVHRKEVHEQIQAEKLPAELFEPKREVEGQFDGDRSLR